MASVTSLPTDGTNSPSSNADTEAAKMLTDNATYGIMTIVQTGAFDSNPTHIVVLSDWDTIASTLPTDATVDGVQVILRDVFGDIATSNTTELYLSINGGSAYSNGNEVDLTGLGNKVAFEDDYTTPSATDELWGLSWDPASLNWDNVWLKIDITEGQVSGANKTLNIDYVHLVVHYTEAAVVIGESVQFKSGKVTLSSGKITLK